MVDEFTTPREIAELNIMHFARLLKTPLDEQTRKIVKRLLAAEISKLAEPPDAEDDPPTLDTPLE